MMRDAVIAVIGLAIAGVVWALWSTFAPPVSPTSSVCTADAMLCPDGSYVGRTGPQCEFVCPSASRSYRDAVFTIDGIPTSITSVGVTYFGNEAVGDLNGDNRDDVAYLVTYDGRGSGNFYYVVVALKTAESEYQGTNAIFLGDRIAPQTTLVQGDTLIVNYAVRGPSEPMSSAPSISVSTYLKVVDGTLRVVE